MKSQGEKVAGREREIWETVTYFLNPKVVGGGKLFLEFPRGNPREGTPGLGRNWRRVQNGNLRAKAARAANPAVPGVG